ncbi:MAG: hypothetical protein WKF30_08445 [Pyrinomonadaceae bacterium]
MADFAHLSGLLAAPLALLISGVIIVSARNVFAKRRTHLVCDSHSKALLAAAVPLAFLASSLDCTGLSLAGCTRYCTAIKTVAIPLLAILGFAFYRTGSASYLIASVVISLAALVPHCLCYNAANAWWIDRLGASPQCYVWGFATTILAASALLRGGATRPWASIAVCYAIIGGAFCFFVGHHYFQFPW